MKKDLQKKIEELKKPRGEKLGLKFTDEAYWPFLGENRGKRLKNISLDFWRSFVKEKDFAKLEDPSKHANQYQTVLGKLLSYGKKKIQSIDHPKKPKNYWLKGCKLITNGKVDKWLKKDQDMPEGFYYGTIRKNFGSKFKKHTEETKKKISNSLKK